MAKSFTARTYHGSLRWLMNFKNPEGQVARWLEVLSSFDMAVEHRPGRLHGNADGLSRLPHDESIPTDKEVSSGSKQGCLQIDRLVRAVQPSAAPNLEVLQAEDDELSVVRSWVENNRKPDFREIAEGSYSLKSLWNQFPCLELRDRLLVRKRENVGGQTVTYQIIVPRNTRRYVLNACHDIKTSGHLGVSKTLSKVKQKVFTGQVFKQMFEATLQVVKLAANGKGLSHPSELLCRSLEVASLWKG